MTNHGESPTPGTPFPMKLYQYLNMVDEMNIEHIVSWRPNGRCFRVHQPHEFIKLSKPSWFVYSKYTSFQRQLNIYGFRRITNGADKNCYYNQYFLRGHPNLVSEIERIPLKKGHQAVMLPPYLPDSDLIPEMIGASSIEEEAFDPTSSIREKSALDVMCARALTTHACRQGISNPIHCYPSFRNEELMSMQLRQIYEDNHVPISTLFILEQLQNMQSLSVHPLSLTLPRSQFLQEPSNQRFLGSTGLSLLDYKLYDQFPLAQGSTLPMLPLQSPEKQQALVSNQSTMTLLERLHVALQSV